MDTALYDLGQKLRKERAELATLLSDPTSLSAEQVDEARKREAALAEDQARFDLLLDADKVRTDNEAKLGRIDAVRRPIPAEGSTPDDQPKAKARTFAEIMAGSAGYKEVAAGGAFKPGDRKTVELGMLTAEESAALIPQLKTLFQLSSAPQEDQRLTRIVLDEQEERSIANLPMPMTAEQNTLSYLEETTFTNAAVETAEGSAAAESALAFTERTITIRWLPTFIPVTEISLADIAWLESYLRGRLGFFISQRLASQILNGDNTGQNLNGYYTAVTQTQAKGSDPTFDAVYKGMVKCLNTGFATNVDGVVLHPNDWQDIRLTRTADGIYILGSPAERGAETLFGVPVVQTTHATEGTGLVGAFREHSGLVVREGVSLAASNSHSSFFVEGKIAIRASMRVALVTFRATAFCEITGI